MLTGPRHGHSASIYRYSHPSRPGRLSCHTDRCRINHYGHRSRVYAHHHADFDFDYYCYPHPDHLRERPKPARVRRHDHQRQHASHLPNQLRRTSGQFPHPSPRHTTIPRRPVRGRDTQPVQQRSSRRSERPGKRCRVHCQRQSGSNHHPRLRRRHTLFGPRPVQWWLAADLLRQPHLLQQQRLRTRGVLSQRRQYLYGAESGGSERYGECGPDLLRWSGLPV